MSRPLAARRRLPVDRLLLCGSGGVSVALLPASVAWIQQHFEVEIRVVLSRAASELVSPKALAVLTRNEVMPAADGDDAGPSVRHLELARWAQAALVAPATANLLAKLVAGIADDLLSTVLLAFEGPIVLAPALPPAFARKPATLRNLEILARDGFGIVPTMEGLEAASSERGDGGMADIPTTLAYLKRFMLQTARAAA